VIENEAGRSEVLQHLVKLTEGARIRAKAEVVVSGDPRQAIQHHSRHAAIVLMGFEPPSEGDEDGFYQRMEHWAGDLPRVVFVDSAGRMSLES
jgi:nucleotide-binding universal stress UspA family protein